MMRHMSIALNVAIPPESGTCFSEPGGEEYMRAALVMCDLEDQMSDNTSYT